MSPLGASLDPRVSPIFFSQSEFDKTLYKPKLKIGFFDEVPNFSSSSSVKRSINMVKKKLEAEGQELVNIMPIINAHKEWPEIHLKCSSIGSNRQLMKFIREKYETPMYFYSSFIFFLKLPVQLQKILAFLVGTFMS